MCEVVKLLLSADLAWEGERPVSVQLPLRGWVGAALRLPVDGHLLQGGRESDAT